ncbi:MAG: ATP-binding protein [Flavobacteriales bacterium]|nr:ATP-binding protein [Flavobacteriales bacterium]
MSYILKYISQGEHQQQDFKMRVDDSKKIAKTLSAYANTDGGRLLIGVKDNGTVCGCNIEEEAHMIEAAANMYCEPPVSYHTQLWKVDYMNVLEVVIEASEGRPHFAINENKKRRAYVRQADRNIVANGVLLKVWQHEASRHEGNFEYDLEKEKLFDKFKTREYLGFFAISRITKLNPAQTEDMLAQLIQWEVVEMEMDGKKSMFKLSHPVSS